MPSRSTPPTSLRLRPGPGNRDRIVAEQDLGHRLSGDLQPGQHFFPLGKTPGQLLQSVAQFSDLLTNSLQMSRTRSIFTTTAAQGENGSVFTRGMAVVAVIQYLARARAAGVGRLSPRRSGALLPSYRKVRVRSMPSNRLKAGAVSTT